MMKYKGYWGEVTFDDEAKIFHGEVIGLKDVITFQGKNVDEIEQAFKDSIDDYLTWCQVHIFSNSINWHQKKFALFMKVYSNIAP